MTATYYTGTLVEQSCGECGIVFGLPEDFRAKRLQDHQSWFCPNGHNRHFTSESDAEKARRERDNALQRASQLGSLLNDEREQHHRTERRLNAVRGVVTRTKRRIAKGLCPQCHQHFGNVEKHIASQHPDYAKDAAHVVV